MSQQDVVESTDVFLTESTTPETNTDTKIAQSIANTRLVVPVSSVLKTCTIVSLLGRMDLLLDTSISSYHFLVKTSAPPPQLDSALRDYI